MSSPLRADKLRIDIWSDIACPWCLVGKRRLESALATFGHADEVEIVWRAIELDPSAPKSVDPSVSYAARLAKKYGFAVADAEKRMTDMTEVARADGIGFRFDQIRPGNTFDAHRVIHFALEKGGPALQGAVKERLLKGYLEEGAEIGAPEAVTRLAADVGLDAEEVRALLASDAFAKEVRADEEEATELGIRGVPFFVIGGKYALSGAQPAELFVRALEQAWSERPRAVGSFGQAAGEVCGPDGCAVPAG